MGQFTDYALDTWFVLAIKYEAGAGGVAIDINGATRSLDSSFGVNQTQPAKISANFYPRTGVIDEVSGANNLIGLINQVWAYNGALSKAQRDVFWRNWSDPEGFWELS